MRARSSIIAAGSAPPHQPVGGELDHLELDIAGMSCSTVFGSACSVR